MLVVVVLFILQILSVNSDVNLVDPTFPKFSDIDYSKTSMLSSASPYKIKEECTPVRAWFLTRHGTKYPSEDTLNEVKFQLMPNIQKVIAHLYEDETGKNFTELLTNQKRIIRKIKNWENVMDTGSHKSIHEVGKLQMLELGKRWNAKLKKLTKNLKVNEIEVLSAIEDRCVVSGKKFIRAFFEGDYDEVDVVRNTIGDGRLKLDKPAEYKVKVVDPEKSGVTMFVEDLYFRENCPPITKRIQKLLFPDHIKDYQIYRAKVTDAMVKIMYNACAHGYYYLNEDGTNADAWCWLFRYEDLKMFEELNDLQYYYKNGYHIKDNTKVGNPITEDLLNFLMNSKGLKFKMFIGHTSNVLSVITRFNLFNDDVKLTVDNIKNMENRKWKSSFMTPVGCNIMVVVYDCGYKTLKVSLYLNEIPLEMVLNNGKMCTKCPIEEFKNLIIGFKTSEIRHSRSDSDSNKEKKREKEEKLMHQKYEKEQEKMKLIDEQELVRWNNALDDKEEYWDKNEQR